VIDRSLAGVNQYLGLASIPLSAWLVCLPTFGAFRDNAIQSLFSETFLKLVGCHAKKTALHRHHNYVGGGE
jgi:hypothetical protein